MSWLLVVGLKNAILALPLAALALVLARWSRRPALAHLLWAIVLVKLLTPPLVDVPVGWQLDVESWLGYASRSNSTAKDSAIAAASREPRGVEPGRHASAGPASVRQATNSVKSGRVGPAARRAAPAHPRAGAGGPAPASGGLVTPYLPSWPVLAGIAWVVGSLSIVAMLLFRAWRFRRYLHWSVKRDEYLAPRVAELAHSVGLTIPPKVIVVDGIVSPMLWGLGQNARLIFPAQLAMRLSPAKLDSLLLHELAHYARGDHWMRALELIAFVFYWWHPVVWWARREIEAAEEECCDAWVVEHQRGTRHSYAEALLTTIDFLCERPALLPPAACGLGEVQLLRIRLMQIMRGQTAARLSRTIQVLVIAAGLVVSPLEPALWATSAPARRKPGLPAARQRTENVPAAARVPSSAGRSPEVASSVRVSLPTTSVAVAPSVNLASVPPAAPARVAKSLWAAAVSPNGKSRLEARTGLRTTLASTQSSFRLDLSAHQIWCVSFAPDGDIFATGHDDAHVRLWDSQTGGLLYSLQGSQSAITSIHIAPDGHRVAAGTKDGSVLVWDLTTGDVAAQLPSQDAPVSCLRWSKKGDRLAIALGDFTQGEAAHLLIWTPQESVVVTEQSLEEPAGALEWLGQDEALIIAGWSGQARIWNLATGQPTDAIKLEKDSVSAAAWSADCTLVPKWLADRFVAGEQE